MLAEKKEYYEKTGKVLKVTPAKYKAEFPWLKEVDSLALCNAQLHLQAAYKNFFRDSSAGFPKFKSKKNPVRSYTTNCVNGNITLQSGKLKLPKAGWIRIKQHRSIDDRYILKGATVSQEADDKYYVSLLYAAEEPEHEIRPVKTAIGLDFSMSELYADSNGAHADYPHFFRKSQEKLAREQRRLSHCEKGSGRYMKQKKKIARLHAHIARQRKDYLHKESRKITNFYDLVCIESLNMKEMSQDSRFGKSVHDNGWGMFTDFLSYKLERAGKKLVRIDKWYPSSKICSCCGKLKKELKLVKNLIEHTETKLDEWGAKLEVKNIEYPVDLVCGILFLVIGIVLLLIMPQQVQISEKDVVNGRAFPTMLVWLMLVMSALLVGREAYNMVMHRPVKTKTLNLLVEAKALVIVLILVVTYLLAKVTDLFVVGAVFCAVAFLLFFRCKKPLYYAITVSMAVLIWVVFRFVLNVSF